MPQLLILFCKAWLRSKHSQSVGDWLITPLSALPLESEPHHYYLWLDHLYQPPIIPVVGWFQGPPTWSPCICPWPSVVHSQHSSYRISFKPNTHAISLPSSSSLGGIASSSWWPSGPSTSGHSTCYSPLWLCSHRTGPAPVFLHSHSRALLFLCGKLF